MSIVSRRRVLAGGLALGAIALSPPVKRALAATHEGRVELDIGTRTIEVKGKPATVFGLTQPHGAHGLIMNSGGNFRVHLTNRVAEPALIHWHGLTPPNAQDGVPNVTQPLLQPGESFDYDFPVGLSGTNWMHSHRGLQVQRLMAAPLVIRDPAEAGLDEQEVVVMLHDFTFRDPEEILSELTKGMSQGQHMIHGAQVAPVKPALEMDHDMSQMDMGSVAMGDTDGSGMAHNSAAPMADLSDVLHDAYLANDRTLDDPQVLRVERGQRVRLRIINGAASTNFMLDLGALEGTLIAVDGRPILPIFGRRFPLAVAQRADIRLTLPEGQGAWPILAQREGDKALTGIVLATKDATIAKVPGMAAAPIGALDQAMALAPVAVTPLAPRAPNRRLMIELSGNMASYQWGVTTAGRAEPNIPVREGERVELEMVNLSGMSHPMHLHGHHFQIVGIDGKRVTGAMRDTVLVPIGGQIAIAFDADNPGRWMFHCHNLYHMVRGMMTEVAYL